ncbi:MAG TPA: alanine--tRNA ligase [Bacillota bacterium]|nr:alanine--tRNA ligase [Peptococcaceae bacterium MAG4]NLW37096.1 alanine--tRNA ligase [Peptococcaceae bacterium]HPZ44413.1 alanine--tRNA ligase [Bacillota bacterium]HQD76894.1 alanine--tRNA ligase [Bacillota bacterium]HUM59743.1 alanine--tRNA ligase [Bacillota bacterium]
MTGNEIRESFLRFFESKGHKRLPSASLIPVNDPSILWTAAGMVPFKPFFTGAAKPEFKRVTTCQKCIRTPDIESVGRTARHHTFFEMLGNFSFGDYFKESAIPWAWEYVTEHLKLPPDKLWVTIYLDDDEAFDIWHNVVKVPAGRIVRMGKDTNFWEIGVGPCGPCSEIYVDLGEERGCVSPDCKVGCDCDRYLEIWNLVFIQFFKDEQGNYTPLEQKGIDTGFGLERVASVMQGVSSNFDTDLLREIMDYTAGLFGLVYGREEKVDVALKVIADHSRAITFAITDGALPSNEGRGYVIRRLLRRAVRFGRLLGIQEPFLDRVAGAVVRQMGHTYPELVERRDHVIRVIRSEEERFGETLNQGTDMLNRIIMETKKAGSSTIPGVDAFKLYDTYGFPLELTQEMASEQGLTVDVDAFKEAMEDQRKRARSARQEVEYISERDALFKEVREEKGETTFVGYNSLETNSIVLALFQDGKKVESAAAGTEVELILDVTPFYAEAGGQVSDRGQITGPGLIVEIEEVSKPVENLFVHRGKVVKGVLKEYEPVTAQVDRRRRLAICRNHSATHLLHKALKVVLGNHVNQAGSLVEPERLRFDFTHYAAVSQAELKEIENTVNRAVMANLPVEVLETSLEEARTMGAEALFGEKYGERVRVVKMGDFSMELCGGTHLRSTAEIGLFKLTGESSIGAGLRRVEAVTGEGALSYIEAKEEQLAGIARLVKAAPQEVMHRVESLLKSIKDLEAENEALQARLARYQVNDLLDRVKTVKGVKVLAGRAEAPDMDSLRGMVDLLRDKIGSGVIVLGSGNAAGGKVNLVAAVTKDLLNKGLHAGKLVKELSATIGGGGGGRPDLAQAGGKDPSRLDEALEQALEVVENQLK